MNIVENKNLKEEEYFYDCDNNTVECSNKNKIENFKLINIAEDNYKNVWLMCRKNDYKFKIRVKNFRNYYYIEDKDGKYVSFDSKRKLKKVLKTSNKFVEDRENIFEYDISNEFRFSIDYIDKFEIEKDYKKYRILFLDIETLSSIDVINTPEPIISISYIDSFTNKKVFMTWREKKQKESFTKNEIDYMIFENEKDMLREFIIRYQQFDIVTGWNILGFDMIYLHNRLEKVKLNKDFLSPVRKVYNKILKDDDRFFGKKFKIFGIDVLDMKDAVKDLLKFSLNKPTNLTLDKVATFFLKNINKIKLDKGISDLWKGDEIDKLAEYNIRDVEILKLLDDKLRLFFYYVNIRNILPSLNLYETQYNSIIIDKMILKEYKNLVFPTKRWTEKLDLIGAYVHESTEGIYKNVGVIDFNSLYPNIIRTFNISPDTIIDYKDEDSMTIDKYNFNLKNPGVLTKLVNNVIKQRYEFKDLKNSFDSNSEQYRVYDSIETAFKAIINSIYGVFGLNSFRLYDNRIASAITYMGRYILKECIDYVNSLDKFYIIRGDTDSVFVYNKKDIIYDDVKKSFYDLAEDINVFIKEKLKKILNEKYHDNLKNINIECETIFTKLINPIAKKKYIGLVKFFKGKELNKEVLYGRNIEIIRRDTPDALKKILNKMMMDILITDNIKETKEKINSAREELKNLDYKELLIVKQINKTFKEYKVIPQHVRAMQYSNKYLNTTFSRDNYRGGMLFVKNINSKYPKTEVLMLDDDTCLPRDFLVDYDKYFNLYIERKLILLCKEFENMFNKNTTLDLFGITKSNMDLII